MAIMSSENKNTISMGQEASEYLQQTPINLLRQEVYGFSKSYSILLDLF